MPLAAAIPLGLFALAVLLVVVLTLWRLVANLRDLTRSLARMSEQLGPALATLQREEALAGRSAGDVEADSARLGRDWSRLRRPGLRLPGARWQAGHAGSREQTDRPPRA